MQHNSSRRDIIFKSLFTEKIHSDYFMYFAIKM